MTWVLVGVLAGMLAGLVMKRGGHGLKTDLVLGLVGSIGGSWLFRALGPFRGTAQEQQRIRAVARGPKCAGELIPVPYRGVELDKCSGCQGVWLDFGEHAQVVAEDRGFFGAARKIFT